MKKFLAIILALAFFSALPARAQEENWDTRLAGASGDVTVMPVDGSPEVSGDAGMPLEIGDRVVVGKGGTAEISLSGGSLITVRENSDFKIEETAKGSSSFFLKVGSMLAKIQKLGNHRLRVRTTTAVAAVRGTEFGVEVDGENTYVGVFDEGKVEVSGADGGKPTVLISNQETSVKHGGGPVRAVQIKRFIARRALMRRHGRRISAIKAKWKTIPMEKRHEMRKKMMERMRERHKQNMEKRAAMRKQAGEKQKQAAERRQRMRQDSKRKMEERRQRINRRKR